MFEKICESMGLVYDSLKDLKGGSDLIAKIDEASNDNEMRKGFKEVIVYMKTNNLETIALKLEEDLQGWL